EIERMLDAEDEAEYEAAMQKIDDDEAAYQAAQKIIADDPNWLDRPEPIEDLGMARCPGCGKKYPAEHGQHTGCCPECADAAYDRRFGVGDRGFLGHFKPR